MAEAEDAWREARELSGSFEEEEDEEEGGTEYQTYHFDAGLPEELTEAAIARA